MTTTTTATTALLLDEMLPRFDTTVRVHRVVEADVMTTWNALLDLDLLDVHGPLIDTVLWLRAAPIRVAARLGWREPAPEPSSLRVGDDELFEGWVPLGRRDGEEIVFGIAGRFWTADIRWDDVRDAEAFRDHHVAGSGRIAAGFTLRPYGARRTLVTYEARTAIADAESRGRFLRYWRVVAPFVGTILRATLRTLATDAEAGARRRAVEGPAPRVDRTGTE